METSGPFRALRYLSCEANSGTAHGSCSKVFGQVISECAAGSFANATALTWRVPYGEIEHDMLKHQHRAKGDTCRLQRQIFVLIR